MSTRKTRKKSDDGLEDDAMITGAPNHDPLAISSRLCDLELGPGANIYLKTTAFPLTLTLTLSGLWALGVHPRRR